jgi:hypothetical protein
MGAYKQDPWEKEFDMLMDRLNLLGAVTAHIIFISSIITFLARMLIGTRPGHWIGIPILLMVFPLTYLLVQAPQFDRPAIYYIQIGLMITWLVVLFIVDYILHLDFRQTRWMVISYVMLYFAASGGMIGIASLAGRTWTISAVILFIIVGVLAFVQRAVTGY